jgi:hypothetical protein
MGWKVRGSNLGRGVVFHTRPDQTWDPPMIFHAEKSNSLWTLRLTETQKTLPSRRLFEFWSLLRSEYTDFAKHSVQELLSFVSKYRCEAAFSKTKTMQRSRLHREAYMRVRLSNIKLTSNNTGNLV